MHPKIAPMPAMLATAALAVAAALGLTACIGDADLADLGAVPAPLANCQWLQRADVLDGQLALDYRSQTSLADGGRLQLHHAADVRGELHLLQRDARGAVWSGALTQGRLSLQDSQAGPGAAPIRRLAGQGAPRVGPGLAGTVLTLRVDFSDCSLRYAARLALRATDLQGGVARPVVLQEMGRLALSGLSAAGGPALSGAWQVPASGDDADAPLADAAAPAGQSLGRYRPAGLAERPGAAPDGMALVRWQFRARG